MRPLQVEDLSDQPCWTPDDACGCPCAHLHVNSYCLDLHVEDGGADVYLTDGDDFERSVRLPFGDGLRGAMLAAIVWCTPFVTGPSVQ